jgi:large subunit ribosomal protein L1
MDVQKAVQDVKGGKIDFKVDKTGIIHSRVGRASFEADKLAENLSEFILNLSKLKPSSSKGTYFKSITLTSTMGPGIKIDKSSIQGL